MNPGALIVAAAALVGVALVVLGLRRPRPAAAAAESGPEPAPGAGPGSPAGGRSDAVAPMPPFMSLIARPGGELQNLRLVGLAPAAYARQRVLGLCGGLASGAAIASLTGRGPTGFALLTGVCALVGRLLPLLGARDTARKLRDEMDRIVRYWAILVAQQVSAGADPATAMLVASRAGRRPGWRLLHRFLLAAQQERRPPWEGLVDLVDRYGITNLAPIVSSLGLAVDRGTRLSEAILVAADSLWDEATSREREKAARRAQIIVLPATAVAIALAGILIYPPFTALTGAGAGMGG